MGGRRTPTRTSKRKIKRNQKRVQNILMLGILLATAIILFLSWEEIVPSGPVDGYIWVHFIDVGQGDSILVQSVDNAVLIDAGTRAAGQAVISHIESLGIDTIDIIVATHPHSDHIGGLPGVMDRFNVGELWMPDVPHDTDTFLRFLEAIERNDIDVHFAQAGDILTSGIIQMTTVAPIGSGYANLNDYSIVLHMQYGETSFLFTGDAEAISEREMVAAGRNLQANILGVGHHGSRTSSTNEFLDAVRPAAAIIQSGAGNPHGHPHPEVLNRFAERGIVVLRNDEMGTITFATDGVYIHIYD